jgi:predicted transcriptional regulator
MPALNQQQERTASVLQRDSSDSDVDQETETELEDREVPEAHLAEENSPAPCDGFGHGVGRDRSMDGDIAIGDIDEVHPEESLRSFMSLNPALFEQGWEKALKEAAQGKYRLTSVQMRLLVQLLSEADYTSYVYALQTSTRLSQETVRSAMRSLAQKGLVKTGPPEASTLGAARKPYTLCDPEEVRSLIKTESTLRTAETEEILSVLR